MAKFDSDKLAALVEKSRLPQQTIAKGIGISQSVLSRWARGTQTPSDENLEKIAQYFHVHPSELFIGHNGSVSVKLEKETQTDSEEIAKTLAKIDELTSLRIVDEFKDGSLLLRGPKGQLYRATELN